METRVCRLYGPHDIRIETEAVAPPGPGEVLVAIGAGGICGSDLHYFHDGGFGAVKMREAIILGHEAAGIVEAVGDGVSSLRPGLRVAINPSRPCGDCAQCTAGRPIHCLAMRFNGSILRVPHVQGLFRDRIVVDAGQCAPVAHASTAEAACAEPLAVCLHAAAQAGNLSGARVLVTGAGPIGALCVAVARMRGAAEIVATDLQDAPLAIAAQMGAGETVNLSKRATRMDDFARDKGYFDVAFECSAAASAINDALACVRPRGTVVQVGVGGATPVPLNVFVGKEIVLRGTHRFDVEFSEAVAAIDQRKVDVTAIITSTWPLEEASTAFAAATDRARSSKVQLSFAH